MLLRTLVIAPLVVSFLALARPAGSQSRSLDAERRVLGTCQPSWLATFEPPPRISGTVAALQPFDDGTGPGLFAGGNFTSVGGLEANRIAKWDGASWATLGSGMNGDVTALAVHDDGGGPALYAGGSFTSAGGVAANRVARWDGSSWTALGSGMNGAVLALASHDDGSGPALYAGGDFTSAGGVAANRIAKWDGSSWTALGSGLSCSVRALASYDDGSGPALFAGGSFTSAGGVAASRIAKWDGSAWTALGSGMSGSNPDVLVLEVFDDGSGPRLFAGGAFTFADGVSAKRIASWDGSSWTTPGSGRNGTVQDLEVFDDGTGAALYVVGQFTNRIAKWSGSSWSLPTGLSGGGFDESLHLAVFDDGTGRSLHVGLNSTASPSLLERCVLSRMDGSSWRALGRGVDGPVSALAVHDDGSGSALYAGGSFTLAGGATTPNRIAKWNGSSWAALGTGTSGPVRTLAVYDDGGGPALYAGGSFTSAGGVAANRIAKWNGSAWSALGSGMNSIVNALTVHDDGSGPALYAAGSFTLAGGMVTGVARWNGSTWMPFAPKPDGDIFALAWSALGSGMSGDGDVAALATFDDGNTRALYAGGSFASALDSGDAYLAGWVGCPDSVAPVLACPDELAVLDSLGGPAGENVFFSVPVSDNLDPAPAVVCVPASGSFFPRGTTLVTCTATDATGNQTVCQFPLTVRTKAQRR